MRFEEGFILEIKTGDYNPKTGITSSTIIAKEEVLIRIIENFDNKATLHVKGETKPNMTHLKLKKNPTFYLIKDFNIHPLFKTKVYNTELEKIEMEE